MKTVVVTGSTRGIGHGLAANFLKAGCKVIISARSQASVDEICSQLAATYGADRVAGHACDITSMDALQGLWDFSVNRFGSVDVWVNNAGMSIARAPLIEQSPQSISAIVNTNLGGLLLANHVVLKGMSVQGHGQLWNMEGFGSGGEKAVGMVGYGATKCAVNYINRSLQKELKGSNVQVCRLSPGIVVTDLLLGDYDLTSKEWEKSKRIFNILGDTVDTVTPFLVQGILKTNKSGALVAWLTRGKAFKRFMVAGFNKRNLFAEIEAKIPVQ